MCHPAHPSATNLRREVDAEERDLADLCALAGLRRIVADAIAHAGRGGIRHPQRRWTTTDLLEVLREQLFGIGDTAALIRRCPPVLDDETE